MISVEMAMAMAMHKKLKEGIRRIEERINKFRANTIF